MRQKSRHGTVASPLGGRVKGGGATAAIRPPAAAVIRPPAAAVIRLPAATVIALSAVAVIASPAVAVVASLGAAAPAFAASPGSTERDVQLVYCLDTAHRGDLVSAAVRLGLLRPDVSTPDGVKPVAPVGRMSLESWAVRHEGDFARACTALMAASSDAPGAPAEKKQDGWFEAFLTSLPLLAVGALLTLGGQISERLASERRLLGQQLDAGVTAFRTAARAYLAAYEADPQADHTAVVTAREALLGALAQVAGPGARRERAQSLADRLPLERPLPGARGGSLLGTAARARDAREVRRSVEGELRAVSELNRRALYWRWRTVRARLTRQAPGAAV
ncbi:hypothetical protein J7E93_30290 [Streptomyces sp. ISL-36]|uniref:hypothetical protein n=1 Tax=Streptomyces sp. ISL-36 TaxID=2819182 RepID=UPI001BEB309B|nr:hypothetical protein [Streptomyces sp. ISL-36]MBT2444308.1 hypothetical protein [Streptomyces sp. ISL-36]